jgi:uncharacterized membrane protein YeaQ/YmgE (transglycosylase-associated protein family)
VFGLIAGVFAKFILPGRDPGGVIVAIMLGIAGGLLGGFIATAVGFGTPMAFDFRSLFLAVGGAVAIPFVHRLLVDRVMA